MINNILIIGDSHAGILARHFYDGITFYDGINIITKPGYPIYSFKYDFALEQINKLPEKLDKSWLVLPFFGEVDIRTQLADKKNPEKVVSLYMEKTLLFFKDKVEKIHFIEPVPQSDIYLDGKNFPLRPEFEAGQWPKNGHIDDRVQMHRLFIDALKKECIINGLDDPIKVAGFITNSDIILPEETIDGLHMSELCSNKLINYIKSIYNPV